MPRSTVAILRTTPGTVLADYHELMNLARYQDVIGILDRLQLGGIKRVGLLARPTPS